MIYQFSPLRLFTAVLLLSVFGASFAQTRTPAKVLTGPVAVSTTGPGNVTNRPKLVVGIVIDQMRYDYLYRYYDKYSTGGFRRLMDQGFNARNNHYHYAATYTGPGHAAIYTGSAPALNGIVGNEFYDRKLGRLVYCAEDTTVETVGATGTAGHMSPRNMLATTIGDQLKLATNGRAKVVGIALKDRGSILPAGHAADGAYWFDSKDGNWITSTFYRTDLPKWAQEFNAKRLPEQFVKQKWETLLPLDKYTESGIDDQPFEASLPGEPKAVFPHEFVGVAGGNKFETLRASPFGDELTNQFALAALKGEQLGQDNITDLLCVSFSSPDYIGHAFGTQSIEIEDNYLRLDRQLAELFTQLDATVGKGAWLAFLSADHGVADIPGLAKTYRIPAEVKTFGEVNEGVKKALTDAFGPGAWTLSYFNQQIYMNTDLLAEKKISMDDAYAVVKRALLKQKGVINVVNLHRLADEALPPTLIPFFQNIVHPNRSGDFQVLLQAGWFEGRTKGTTHGTTYSYDTHVPFLLYGWGIKPGGQTFRRTRIADIAPTICALLGILEPSACVGDPVEEVFK